MNFQFKREDRGQSEKLSKEEAMVSERLRYHLTLLKILGEYRIHLKIAKLFGPGFGSGERKEKGNGRDRQPW